MKTFSIFCALLLSLVLMSHLDNAVSPFTPKKNYPIINFSLGHWRN